MKNLTPAKQLQLYLAEAGFPSTDLPRMLEFCPQLIHKFSIEDIAALGMSDISQFRPVQKTLYLRPFVYEIIQKEAGVNNITNFIEDAACILAADTIESTLTNRLLLMQKALRDG